MVFSMLGDVLNSDCAVLSSGLRVKEKRFFAEIR